jgi:hypothetical protein
LNSTAFHRSLCIPVNRHFHWWLRIGELSGAVDSPSMLMPLKAGQLSLDVSVVS